MYGLEPHQVAWWISSFLLKRCRTTWTSWGKYLLTNRNGGIASFLKNNANSPTHICLTLIHFSFHCQMRKKLYMELWDKKYPFVEEFDPFLIWAPWWKLPPNIFIFEWDIFEGRKIKNCPWEQKKSRGAKLPDCLPKYFLFSKT